MDQPIEESGLRYGTVSLRRSAQVAREIEAQINLYNTVTAHGSLVADHFRIKEEKEDEASEVHFSFSRDGCVGCADCGSFGCLFKEVKCKKKDRKEEPK